MSDQHDAQPGLAPEEQPDIEVVIDAGQDAGVAAAGEVQVEAARAAAPAPEVDYADLKRQLDEERAGRAEERRQRETAQRDVATARAAETDGRLGQVNLAIENWTGHAAKLKRDLVEANQRGDFDAAAQLIEDLGKAGHTMARLAENKAYFEQAKKAPPQQPQRQAAPQGQAPADPVEAFAAGRPAKTQDWVRRNPDFVRDPKKFQRLQGAHVMALADHADGSDGYFAAVDQILGLKAEAAGEAAVRRATPVAAPVSRAAPSLTRAPVSPQSVRLTATEVEMAKASGLTPKEWATEKLRLAAERSGATTH